MKIDILGVKIDRVTMDEVLKTVSGWLKKEGKRYVSPKAKGKVLAKRGFYIVTPNPEFIVAAQKDREFREILNKADLAIPDSFRLGLSYWLLKKSRWERLLLWPLFFLPIKVVMQFDVVTGTDLMEGFCKLSAENGFTTGFLGGRDEVAKRCAECLLQKYPKLKVAFAESGGGVDNGGRGLGVLSARYPVVHPRSTSLAAATRRDPLLAATPRSIPPTDILFVAFGHIKQEKWIAKNLPDLPVKVAIGVGGAFDYLSGSIPRAPKRLRNIGFEWLFRLIIQPWRIKRQLALFKFIFYVMVK